MNDFWLGFSIAVCWNAGVQDWMGKAKYIQTVDALWIQEPLWLWVVFALGATISNIVVKKLKP